jgi:adenine/guanine phosphoribosyltransferase-like PRPP-binding protein
MQVVSEYEFRERITAELADSIYQDVGAVTGPGRSGAIAAVYASHILRVPFIPFKQKHPSNLGRLLIIDTAIQTGKTLRKAERWYAGVTPLCVALYNEPPRVCFWYERDKPQFYKHELTTNLQ